MWLYKSIYLELHIRFVATTLTCLCLASLVLAEDCTPKRNCDENRACSLQEDTRSCGHDIDLGFLGKHHVNDPICEAQKAAQNAGFAAAKASCEAQKSAEKLDCERLKEQMKAACEAGIDGPFSCSADEVLGQLRTSQQDKLTDFDELAGFVTTPLKKVGGQLSFRETACQGSGVGVPYRNSQRSTDGFCTIDIQLMSFAIDGHDKPTGDRFLRLELLPGGRGAQICAANTISVNNIVRFGGPVKIDRHLVDQRWLEVHVTDDFDVTDHIATSEATWMAGVTRCVHSP